MSQLALHGSCQVENLGADGLVLSAEDFAADPALKVGYKYTFTKNTLRTDKKLPFLIPSKLKGAN